MDKKYDLQDRLVAYASAIINQTDRFQQTFAVTHLSKQLIRSATSAALNYGEAQSAESRRDFIHKLRLSTKELKESLVSLKILRSLCDIPEELLQETNELISIFMASIATAKKNMESEKRN